jgi:prevent-host-death family protein
MKRATITEAKNGLSALIDRVRAGETVVVTDRGRAVARIEPVRAARVPEDLQHLERAGLVRIGKARPPIALVRTPGPPATGAVAALLDERREGR